MNEQDVDLKAAYGEGFEDAKRDCQQQLANALAANDVLVERITDKDAVLAQKLSVVVHKAILAGGIRHDIGLVLMEAVKEALNPTTIAADVAARKRDAAVEPREAS